MMYKHMRNQLVLRLVFFGVSFFLALPQMGRWVDMLCISFQAQLKQVTFPDVGTNFISISLHLKYSIVLDVALGHDQT